MVFVMEIGYVSLASIQLSAGSCADVSHGIFKVEIPKIHVLKSFPDFFEGPQNTG